MPRTSLFRFFPRPRIFAIYSVISAAIGMLIIGIIGLGREGYDTAASLASGAMLGVFLNLGAIVVQAMLFAVSDFTRRLNLLGQISLAVVNYFVGGCVGFSLAWWISKRLGWGAYGVPESPLPGFVVFGLVTVTVGMTFYLVRWLRGRLEESIERIKEQEYVERELETARALQRRLLPAPSMTVEGVVVEARNLPARIVAGDFYDVFRLPDGAVGLVVGDVSGKGMAASLLMASVKATLPFLTADRPVDAALAELNRRLVRDLGSREFVALCLAVVRPETGEIEIGNAGLPDPYLLGPDGALALEVPGPRLPLGVKDGLEYQSLRRRLPAGGAVLLLSDGLPEAPDATGEPIGYAALESQLARLDPTRSDLPDRLIEAFERERPGGREDDWSLLFVRLAAKSQHRDVPDRAMA